MLLWTLTAMWLTKQGTSPPDPCDAIVVLGCRVLPSGALSATLRRRVEASAALVHAKVAQVVVVTGGAVNGSPVEATAMARELRKLGLTESQILLESQAQNTMENAKYTVRMLPGARLLVVSDGWHLPRALACFRREGAQAQGFGVQGPLPGRIKGALREAPGYLLSRLRAWR